MKENTRVVILDTIQAVHADSVTSNEIVYFQTSTSGLEPITRYLDIVPGTLKITPRVVEVLQVTTLTVATATAGLTYSIYISQYNRNTKLTYSKKYIHIAPVGATTTTIAQALRAMILADTNLHGMTATGAAAVITISGVAGYPSFTYNRVDSSTLMTWTTGTAGVYSVNSAADLTRLGVTGFTGGYYTSLYYQYTRPANEQNAIYINQWYSIMIYFQSFDAALGVTTNSGTLLTYLNEQFAGLAAGGAAIDGEIVAVI